MGRRTKGEGSLYKEGDLWTAAIVVDGKRMVKRARRQEDARNWLIDTRSKANQGMIAPEGYKQTVGEFLAVWLTTHRAAIKPKTAVQYEYIVRVHLVPALGKHKLGDLRPPHLQNMYTRKLADGLSPRTVQLMHTLLHKALKQALLWGLIARNVAEAADPPKPQRKELSVWTPEQTRAFLMTARGEKWEAYFIVAVMTGLRRGELAGLRWADLDLTQGRLQVRRTLGRVWKQGLVEGSPKSAMSRRQVLLPARAVQALKEHRRHQLEDRLLAGDKWQEADFVFTSTVGTPAGDTAIRRSFLRLIAAAGLPRIRLHDLRHGFATLQLAAGTHPKKVQAALGHSSIQLTMDTYSHVMESMQEEVREATEKALGF